MREPIPDSSFPCAAAATPRPSSAELADLYLRYWRPKAQGILRALGIAVQEREDLAQDCFVGLFEKRATVPNPESYFLQSVRLRSIDQLRLRARWTFVQLEEAFASLVDTNDPARLVDLQRLLAQLESHERELIESRWLDGRDHEELAKKHGIRIGSMRTKLCRAMLALRRLALGEPKSPTA